MLAKLTCRTIGDLNGGIAEKVIDAAFSQAVDDLEDRGLEDGKPRVVQIAVEIVKHAADLTLIDVKVDCKLPPRRVPTTSAASRRMVVDGDPVDSLLFQTANPKNPAQATFPQMDVAGGEVASD